MDLTAEEASKVRAMCPQWCASKKGCGRWAVTYGENSAFKWEWVPAPVLHSEPGKPGICRLYCVKKARELAERRNDGPTKTGQLF